MPVLLVPPVQAIPFDAARLARDQKRMDEFRNEAVNAWGATGGEEVRLGAFRRSRTYGWSESFDAVLRTYFVYSGSPPSSRSELAKVAVLFRKDNCQLLGSSVVWGADWTSAVPENLRAGMSISGLKSAAARKFDTQKSPVRLSFETFGYWAPAMAWLSEAFVGERLSADGLVVHSDLSGLDCFRTETQKSARAPATEDKSSAAEKPLGTNQDSKFVLKKGHRQLKLRLEGIRPKSPLQWPLVTGDLRILSLPFNIKRTMVAISADKQASFDPEKIAALSREEVLKHVQALDDKSIKVNRRDGRFVIVERGLAYGLKIGMHLTGPGGAQLHVIRFEPSAEMDDSAILLIRKESAAAPLAAGMVLNIDPSQYPKQ